MSKIIVMMGAPGAGKGTQARLLAEKCGFPQISTGDILREMARADTPLGREIQATMAAGNFVSDEVLASVILARTSQPDCSNGYILDGYPRTLDQAQLLEEIARRQNKKVRLFKVVVPREALMKRLTGRRTCTQCGEIYNIYLRPPQREGVCDLDGAPLGRRADDNPETVSERLESYDRLTGPLIDYYRQHGRLVEINGDRSVEEIFSELYAGVGSC
jgi:adenylate kinase